MADIVAAQLRRKPDSCLGLPTGRSPLGGYRLLSQWSQAGKLDWSKASAFALDEYLNTQEEETFAHYLEENLFKFTNLPKDKRFNPAVVDNYDALISEYGGFDLTILGIGTNGHIAFNEPGTPKASWTHCLWLSESTRAAIGPGFKEAAAVPSRGISIGIETILSSRKIILLASGKNKQAVLERALSEPLNVDLPVSFLALHTDVTVFSDFEHNKYVFCGANTI